ncbi:ATP-dependent RNA helicase HrpA [Aeromicrobium fastidiosum]|uniref:ATP-dependent RNA helicase HrpA n=1 Tax=Aeromicrobium fastidiosum TaxID=52699 RepID=A0A641AP09_9ACTN|nr:ATP-dependent RNA helicase HrpA [Aeromicrobium fastidiosum]KAA1376379.1 ATP-dependent RNA helicase HrpA [Aeromicrobium fastidiosum]MBP2391715.1 ATP-dependent helicase HrpA [Aeromicrobium fastidiosum]
MKIEYPAALPISERHDDIAAAIRDHQVVVVAGETGSGKTTQLPKIAYELGRRSIAHTQPRRIAARSVAKRIADECEVELGGEVGYAVRFDDQTSESTAIRLVTDGLLLAELQRDRRLSRYDTIIIDEAHERSLSIDFLLGYLKQLLPRRPDLKVVITSATIDVERFAEMFDAPIIEVSGRTFPVEIRYRPLAETGADNELDALAHAVEELFSTGSKDGSGDILVFMSGEREIRDAAEFLSGRKYPRTEILPLYGRLAAADQQKIFSSHAGRRIVLATNVAETSLTVPGIRYVIDPGFARISRFSQRLKVQRLPIEPISQASASQRAGRCGRVADGICIRLYSEEDHDGRPEFTDPEIQRTNLASVLLQMASLDLGDIKDFPFLDPPDSRAVSDGLNLLYELGALDTSTKGSTRLTKIGRRMSTLPTDPRLARMLLAADRLGCLGDVLVIVAAMSIQDPRERPLEHQQAADEKHRRFREPDSDFLSYLTLWKYVREMRDELSSSAFRRLCRDEYLHWLRIREWQDVHSQLRRTAKELGLKPGAVGADPDRIHQALLSGLLSHIGLKDADGREYLGARQAKFMIFPGSGLAKKTPRMVMVGELVETGRLWGRTAAKIQPEWVEAAGEHLINRSYSEPHWSTRRGAVMAREKLLLFGIPLVADRLVQFGRIDPVTSRDLFIRHALVQGEWKTNHAFFAANQRMIASVEELEERLRRRDLRVDDDTLYAFYDQRVPADVVSTRHFDTWWKKTRQTQPDLLTFDPAMLSHGTDDADEEFPREWHSDGASYPLTYAFEPGMSDDGVTVDLPLAQLMVVDDRAFDWHVPGHRVELVTELVRSMPKRLRREFVPAGQFAPRLVEAMDPGASDLSAELARQMRMLNGTVVSPDDFDFDALPSHLRVTFRVVDGAGMELGRGKDLAALRSELSSHVRADLTKVARQEERSGIRSWDVGTIEPTITAGQVTGYPSLVDEGTSLGLRILDTAEEQQVAMVKAQARLLSFSLATPVPQLGRSLDLHAKLLLSTGPHGDAAAVIEECWLAALESLVVRHGGPVWDEATWSLLHDAVRPEAYGTTERAVQGVIATLRALGDVTPLPSTEAGEDVRVQLSWLIYPGFIRDVGVDQLRRLPLYLQAAAKRLAAPLTDDLLAAQDLEARFHARTAELSVWARLSPRVQHVRWALEELRIGLLAQGLRTAFPVSVKRVTALVDAL